MDDLISRREAIDALEKAIRNDPYYDSNERINGLGVCDVRVIINDLPSAQPKSEERKAESAQNVTKEDLISRKAAIDAVHKAGITEYDETLAIEEIERVPSAQPERPKGHWMICDNQRREDIKNGNYMYTCTNCLHSDIHAKNVTVPFCWNCGADMREDTDAV